MPVADQIRELDERKFAIKNELRDMLTKAESEDRDLTAEETQEFDKREAELDTLEKRSGRLDKMGEFEDDSTPERRIVTDALDQLAKDSSKRSYNPSEIRSLIASGEMEAPKTLKEFNELRQAPLLQDDPEYRWAFYRMLTAVDERELSPEEVRVLSKASAGAGLNTVPTSFQRTLVDSLRTFGVMREISNVITTNSGEALQVPTVTAHGTASWTAENAAFSPSDETFGQSTLNAWKAATLIKVSEELLADSAFDLEAFITDQFGLRIGVLENTAYVAGDGSSKPTGVTTQASAGVTAAGAAAITANELIDLYYSLAPPYRRNARFVVNDSTVKLVRKLADTTGQYIWNPGLQASEPDTLLGKPIHSDPDMPAATTGLVSALFGDFSYYWIRDVNGIAFQRLNELYAENGQVGFRAYHRTDGKLMNTAAVKKLTQA